MAIEEAPKMRNLIVGRLFNSALFYIAWLVCIHQAIGPYPLVGPAVIGFLLILHLHLSKEKSLETVLIFSVALFGTFWDSIYIHLGWVDYKGGYENFPGIIPLWMTALWAFYATTINHSLAWAQRSLWLMILLGGFGGAASYAVAFRLGAATLSIPLTNMLVVIGCVWAVIFPMTFYYNDWLKTKLED